VNSFGRLFLSIEDKERSHERKGKKIGLLFPPPPPPSVIQDKKRRGKKGKRRRKRGKTTASDLSDFFFGSLQHLDRKKR